MLKLKSLTISGFRSFKETATILFPQEGAMLISGSYSDGSGGSSGSGKSSIILAVAHSFGFCDVPATELKNWYSKKYSTDLELEDDGKVYRIVRDPKLSVYENGVIVPGGTADAEAKLAAIVRTPLDLAKNLVYRPQLSRGEFLNSTDAQKKEFLSTMLGLQQIEAAHDKVNQDLTSKNNEIMRQELGVQAQVAAITNYDVPEDQILAAETKLEAAAKAVEAAETKLQPAEDEYANALHNEVQAKSQADAFVPDTSKGQAEYTKLVGEARAVQATIEQYNSLSRKGGIASAQNKTVRSQIMTLQGEIEEISQSICPTCKREWNQGQTLIDQKTKNINDLLATMQANIEAISAGEQAQAKIPELQQQYDETKKKANAAVKPAEDQVQAHEAAKSVYASAKAVTQATRMTKQSVEQGFANAQFALASARSILGSLRDRRSKKDEVAAEIEKKNQDLEILRKSREPLEHALKLLSRDGFLGLIFDEVLAEIETRANEMVTMIPNIATFTISITSTHTTKVGAIKREIKAKVLKDGFEVNLKAVSGGQVKALELCSDLAVRETIRARFGSNLGFVILDEAMENLGPYEKSWALEAVKSKVKGQIIIIDHSTEIKEGFASSIEVKFDGRNSWIEETK